MRISDWSSDVCSSDLVGPFHRSSRRWNGPTPPAGSFATAGADMTERQAVAREEVALPLVEVEDLSKIFDVSPPLLNRLLQGQGRARFEERRVGKECVRTCNTRWSPYPSKTNNN